MQRLEDSGAVRPIYGSLGVKRLMYGVNMGRGKRFRGGENVLSGICSVECKVRT